MLEEGVVQRPEGVAAEHRDGAGGEVDDPRPSVGQHDGERDAGDQRSRAEAEEDEQQNLLHWSFLVDVGGPTDPSLPDLPDSVVRSAAAASMTRGRGAPSR